MSIRHGIRVDKDGCCAVCGKPVVLKTLWRKPRRGLEAKAAAEYGLDDYPVQFYAHESRP